MKKLMIMFLVLVMMSSFIFSTKKKPKTAISIELFSGYSLINPADLNLLSDYNTAYYNYYSDYYNNSYSNDYRVTDGIVNGEFKKIKNAFVLGGRMKFRFAKKSDVFTKKSKFSLSLGVKYLQQSENSEMNMSFDFDDFYQGSNTMFRETKPMLIWVEGFIPQIGIHYSVFDKANFSVEAFCTGGPIFAICGSVEQYLYGRIGDTGYAKYYETIKEYNGTGNGIAFEGGVKVQMNFNKYLGVFIEGGYALQKISQIDGDALNKINSRDNNGDGNSEEFSWDGVWKVLDYSLGSKHMVDYNGLDSANSPDFTLDLSEFYIRAGISILVF